MATICLVRPLLSPSEFNGYPLNLLILASALRMARHTVVIRDYDYLKELDGSWASAGFARRAAADVLACQPDFVGITAMCSNYVLALDLASELKAACPAVHITFGGPHVSLCATETLARYPWVDSAVIGEGEVTYPALLEALERGADLASVSGVAFRNLGTVTTTARRSLLSDLNLSPRPAYDLVDVPSYARLAKSSYLEVYVGSGCPFSCTFCSTSIVWERKYRTMSADRIVSEMQELSGRYGATAFNLIHDNLSSDKEFIQEIAALIRQRDLRIRWGFSSRIDTINLETIRVVAEAGCDYIFFGVESGSEKTQLSMKKRLKLREIRHTLDLCLEHRIAPTTSFILGFPEEVLDDVASTIRLAFQCKANGARRSFINLLSPYTGTQVMRASLGRLEFHRDSVNSTMISFLEEHHFAMIIADPFIFANFYALDYERSPLSAKEYSDLVDFYTVCLFRYAFTISFLINEAGIDPISLFGTFAARVARLSVSQRNHLDFDIRFSDLQPYVAHDDETLARSLLAFDHALRLAGLSKNQGLLYTGSLLIRGDGLIPRLALTGAPRHYLLHAKGDRVNVSEIDGEISLLYELQGLPAVRVAESDEASPEPLGGAPTTIGCRANARSVSMVGDAETGALAGAEL